MGIGVLWKAHFFFLLGLAGQAGAQTHFRELGFYFLPLASGQMAEELNGSSTTSCRLPHPWIQSRADLRQLLPVSQCYGAFLSSTFSISSPQGSTSWTTLHFSYCTTIPVTSGELVQKGLTQDWEWQVLSPTMGGLLS